MQRFHLSSRIYQAMVHTILLYGCETWPAQVADERIPAGFENDSILRILHVRRRDCVSSVELRRRLARGTGKLEAS